jgi:membrane protease YdiL (CAAX protease family)
MKRYIYQYLLILLFLILGVIIVMGSPLLTSWTGSPIVTEAGTYALVILASLLFIRLLGLHISWGRFLVGSVAAIASMGLIFVIFVAAGFVSAVSLRDNFMLILLVGAVVQLFVAFGEELAFRSVVFGGLDVNLGFWPAAAISAVVFALLHVPSMFTDGVELITIVVGLCNILILGVVLAMLYKYGGLLNAVAFHFFWNFMEYYMLTFGSVRGALMLKESGSVLLTGGSFGPEASIIALPVVAAMAITVWYYYRKKGSIGAETIKPSCA